MKILDFFSSPIGLGHVTRDIAIVNYFQNDSINFVTGGGAAKILKNLKYSVSDKYNPPLFEIKKGVLQNSTKWLWNYYKYYKKHFSSDYSFLFNGFYYSLMIFKCIFASVKIAITH